MNEFKFQVLEMRDSSPEEWLRSWAERFDEETGADPEYASLIGKSEPFSAHDFRLIGKWKDNAWTDGKWKANVAQVAYLIWEAAARELPKCPEASGVEDFLKDWSNREFTNEFKTGPVRTHFGLSRATTLLHFLSRGRYPIFDSRVRTAIARLGHPNPPDTVSSYMDSCILLEDLMHRCGAKDFRELDKALFSFGALDKRFFREH